MKFFSTLLLLIAGLFPLAGFSQLQNGGLYGGFGVDADTRANYMKYGLTTGSVTSDDWFSPALSGYNVIETSNAANYLSLLQSGSNICFNKRMSEPLYSAVRANSSLDAACGTGSIPAQT